MLLLMNIVQGIVASHERQPQVLLAMPMVARLFCAESTALALTGTGLAPF